MHVGMGLAGPLRLALESIVPRFINRYNALREQMSRLIMSSTEGVEKDDTHEIEGKFVSSLDL